MKEINSTYLFIVHTEGHILAKSNSQVPQCYGGKDNADRKMVFQPISSILHNFVNNNLMLKNILHALFCTTIYSSEIVTSCFLQCGVSLVVCSQI